jgi:hypothetical protein
LCFDNLIESFPVEGSIAGYPASKSSLQVEPLLLLQIEVKPGYRGPAALAGTLSHSIEMTKVSFAKPPA